MSKVAPMSISLSPKQSSILTIATTRGRSERFLPASTPSSVIPTSRSSLCQSRVSPLRKALMTTTPDWPRAEPRLSRPMSATSTVSATISSPRPSNLRTGKVSGNSLHPLRSLTRPRFSTSSTIPSEIPTPRNGSSRAGIRRIMPSFTRAAMPD